MSLVVTPSTAPSPTTQVPTPSPTSAPTFNGGAPVITVSPPDGQSLSSSTVAVLAYGGLLCVVVLIFTLGWIRVLVQLGIQRLSLAYRRFRGIPDPPPQQVPVIRLPSAARRASTGSHSHQPHLPHMSTVSTSNLLSPSANMDRRHSTSSHRSIPSTHSASSSITPRLEPRAINGPAADVLTHEDLRRLSWLQASQKGHVVLTIEPPRPGEPIVGFDDDLPRYDIGTNNASAPAASDAATVAVLETSQPAAATFEAVAEVDHGELTRVESVVSADSTSPFVPHAQAAATSDALGDHSAPGRPS